MPDEFTESTSLERDAGEEITPRAAVYVVSDGDPQLIRQAIDRIQMVFAEIGLNLTKPPELIAESDGGEITVEHMLALSNKDIDDEPLEW